MCEEDENGEREKEGEDEEGEESEEKDEGRGWGEEEVGRRKRRKTKGGQEAEGPLLGPHRCYKPQESKETRGRADRPVGAVLTTRA